MATLYDLLAAGLLIQDGAGLEDDEVPVRFIYRTASFDVELVEKIMPEPMEEGHDTTPLEQVEQAFYEFAIGRPFIYGVHNRKLDPLDKHVWELKTPAVRIFGWFPRKGCFVCTRVAMKRCLKRRVLYTPFIRSVCDFRNALDLDPPKALMGVRCNDVL